MERLIHASCRLYARLLALLPGEVRADYADLMTQAFGDLCRAAWRERGAWGLVAAWGWALLDLASSAWNEWLSRMRRRWHAQRATGVPVVWAGRADAALVLVSRWPAQVAVLLAAVTIGALVVLGRGATSPPVTFHAPTPAARLMLAGDGWLTPESMWSIPVAPIDPATLASLPGVVPLPTRPCNGRPVVSPTGQVAAMLTMESFAGVPATTCADQRRIGLSVFDLQTWSMRTQIPLSPDDGSAHQLAPTQPARPPVAWSPDGQRLYALTTSQPNDLAAAASGDQETRELARRPSPFPLLLVGGPSMLGDPIPF